MEIFVGAIALLAILGAGLAIYEWRKGKSVLRHDLSRGGPQSEADRETIRSQEAVRNRTFLDGGGQH